MFRGEARRIHLLKAGIVSLAPFWDRGAREGGQWKITDDKGRFLPREY